MEYDKSNIQLPSRHGWGCTPDPEKAVIYLSGAASNSAAIEAEALESGLKKGGAAKGELILAIFELGNCFRNGWGVKKDPAAARQYFETAANLGDADAMNEAAWCYVEGFGGKKDKVSDWMRDHPPHDQQFLLGIHAWNIAMHPIFCFRVSPSIRYPTAMSEMYNQNLQVAPEHHTIYVKPNH